MRWLSTIILLLHTILLGSINFVLANTNTLDTQIITTAATLTLTQSNYRFYENANVLTPTSTLASEATSTSTPEAGTVLRLRINILDTGVQLNSGTTFKLQYAQSTSGSWTDLGVATSWIFFDNPGVADGQSIVTTVLSDSDVGESYNESNPTTGSPITLLTTQRGEWDWVIKNNSAATSSDWFFRMIYSSSTALNSYDYYPSLTAVTASTPPPPSPGNGGGGGGSFQVAPITGGVLPSVPSIEPDKPPVPPIILSRVDCNADNRIDMADLSIMLYYFGSQNSAVSCSDLNDDSITDMADISILLFYWTA